MAINLRNCLSRQSCCVSLSKRRFCSKDGDDVKKDSEEKVNSKENLKRKEAISKQLIEQILSMKVSVGPKEAGEKLNLARPTWNEKQARIKEMKKIEKEKEEASRDPDLESSIVSAVKDVASNLGGDVEKTESELLQKLRSHKANTEEIKSGVSLGDLFTGLKIDRVRPASQAKVRDQLRGNFPDQLSDDVGGRFPSGSRNRDAPLRRSSRVSLEDAMRSDMDLFGAPPLNIFSKKVTVDEAKPLDFPVLKTWDDCEMRELELSVTHPFANAFEEHIKWTKDGILWKFPINNEQGIDEEAKVGFHEHVFLEDLISDFPKKGPVRHFMELVIVGLSKNPYITVQQKKDHIDWFRSYFNEKAPVLKEIGALG